MFYWVSYLEQVKFVGGKFVYVEGFEENYFKIFFVQLKNVIMDKIKVIVINFLSNLIGVMYMVEELVVFGEVCFEYDILIVFDEIYEKFIYGGKKYVFIVQLFDSLKEQMIIINGVLKLYSMMGWRIGYVVGFEDIIKVMMNFVSYSMLNLILIVQYGVIVVYNGFFELLEEMREVFEYRLNIIYVQFVEISGFSCVKLEGVFYLFLNVKEVV